MRVSQITVEIDIRVPFFANGPGIAPGTFRDEIVTNVDFLPTFLELSGQPIPDVDGRSFAYMLRGQKTQYWRDHYLAEYYSIGKKISFWFRGKLILVCCFQATITTITPQSGRMVTKLLNAVEEIIPREVQRLLINVWRAT